MTFLLCKICHELSREAAVRRGGASSLTKISGPPATQLNNSVLRSGEGDDIEVLPSLDSEKSDDDQKTESQSEDPRPKGKSDHIVAFWDT